MIVITLMCIIVSFVIGYFLGKRKGFLKWHKELCNIIKIPDVEKKGLNTTKRKCY